MPGEQTDEPDVETSVDTQDTEERTEIEQVLLAGKYKTVEELESAYREAEGKMHDATTKASAAQQTVDQWQAWYNSTQSTDQRGDPSNAGEEDEGFVLDRNAVRRESAQTTHQFLLMDRRSQANIKRELGTRRRDKTFGKVAESVEAALLELDPSITANPETTAILAERMFNEKVGEYYRKQSEVVKADPKARKAFLDEIGVESPSSAPAGNSEEEIGSDGRELLASLGVSKEGFKRIEKRIGEKEDQ